MFQPLTLNITNSQRPILEEAIENFRLKSTVKMGDAVVLSDDNKLVIDPIDFCSTLHYMNRTPSNELEAFRIRMLGVKALEKRISQCKSESSKRHYQSVIKLLEQPEIGTSVGQPTIEQRHMNRPKQFARIP